MPDGGYTYIAELTPSGVSTASFSNITQAYKHLAVFMQYTTNTSDAIPTIRGFVGASGQTQNYITNNFTSASLQRSAEGGATVARLGSGASYADSRNGRNCIWIDIFNYSSTTTTKTILARTYTDASPYFSYSGAEIIQISSAINGLTFGFVQAATFNSTSLIQLYGVNGV